MSSSTLRRWEAAALGGSLLASGLVLAAPAPTARAHETDPAPADIGARWLESELTNGVIHNDQFNFDDFGATVEAAYALDAVDSRSKMGAIINTLRTNADAYTSPGAEVWAGSTGKLLSFVEDQTTSNPRTFGGVDLVAQMESVTAPSGRIADVSAFGDFSNAFGQAWAARGLSLAGSTEAPAALDFLLDLQCGPGFFHLDFATPCSDPAPPVDTAAVVVVLLADLAPADADQAADLDAAIADAIAWIKTQQAGNGSFDGGTATEGPNANSTGLAGWALSLADEHEAAEAAATWIRARQASGLDCEGELSDELGAIAYDQAAYAAGKANGITVPAAGQWDFATIQALPALLSAPASEVNQLRLRVPYFLNGGGKQRVTVKGLAPGERACVSIGRNVRAALGAADGTSRVRVPVPDRTGYITAKAVILDEAVGIAGIVALAAKKLPVDLRDSVAPGGTQRVVVRGLWAGEPVVVKNDGDAVARGKADEGGRFVARFEVGRQRGDHKVTARGRFADRRNAASYHVG